MKKYKPKVSKKRLAVIRLWRSQNKDKIKAIDNRRSERDKIKRSVRNKTYQLILRGYIKPQSCKCGDKNTQAHHNSYDREDSYLDIEWLCHDCHLKAHFG